MIGVHISKGVNFEIVKLQLGTSIIYLRLSLIVTSCFAFLFYALFSFLADHCDFNRPALRYRA